MRYLTKCFTEQDFKNLLVNRDEIENALGVVITQHKDTDVQYLEDYSMFKYIRLQDIIAIFLGIDPKNHSIIEQHPRYSTIYNAIEVAVRNKDIEAKVEQASDINGNEIQFDISLSHDVARKWAEVHNLKWNIPPYKEISIYESSVKNNNKPDEVIDLAQQLNQANATITELQARIAELENQKQVEIQTIAEPKQIRIQRHHKALFALLVKKNYNGFDTRNSLFNAINADLKSNGIIGNEVKFDTYNKLIDDELFKQLEIFPNKKH